VEPAVHAIRSVVPRRVRKPARAVRASPGGRTSA
jgi:hypothetical protein